MNQQELIEYLLKTKDQKVKVAVTDIDGILRGKTLHVNKVIKALSDGFGFCDVIFGWDSTDTLYDQDSVTGWYKGFPDAKASIDITTFRELPWDHHVPLLLADFEHSLPEICPRSILKRQVDKAVVMGYETKFAMEFEWFNFKKESSERTPISTGMLGYSMLRSSQFQDYWHQVFTQLEQANIQLEGLHTETGPGVMEAAIDKTDILSAADKAVLFKSAVKEIASQHGIMATFMAKWNSDLPGCSGHMHQSLCQQGRNLFENHGGKLPNIQESYLAGILYTLPYLMPMYAPTINSYKRLVPGSWAPTTVSWGIENRTTACRIISGKDQGRIEMRVPGADNNPYLSMAASLAAGLYGIQHHLTLDQVETTGNAYQSAALQKLPTTLKEANQQMKNSEIAIEIFGQKFVDHFCMTRDWEIHLHERQVADWELNRYFESI